MKKHVKILLVQLTVFVVVTALIVVAKFLMPWFVDSFLLNFSSGIGHFVGLGTPYLLALFVLLLLPRRLGIRRATFKPELGLISPILMVFGVLLVFSAQLVVSPVVSAIPLDFMSEISNELVSVMESGFWPMFTFIFVIPLIEEWIYRGIIQTTLVKMMGVGWGLIAMALFSAFAEISPQIAIVGMASSLIYGAIYFVKGSLTTVYAIHVLCNGFTYLLYLFFGSTGLVRDVISDYELVYVVLWAVAAILLVGTFWWVSHHNSKLRIKNILIRRKLR